MKIKFNSEIFIEDKRSNILAKVIGVLIGGMILIKTFIEILTSAFNIIHILYILFAIIIIIAWSLIGFKLIQCAALGEIEANCFTKHTYMKSKKKKLISDTKEENKIFIYVRDSDTASNILNNLEKYTGITVKILE